MALGQHKRAVGVFSSRQDAERALNELHRSGFPMNKVSIIARDADQQDDIAGVDVSGGVGNKADESAKSGALTGGALGGITGLLVGLGSLAIPGVGPVVLAGEVATTLATTLAGGAIGAAAGGLIGALIGLGIPEERARVYNNRVSRGDYLVIVNGTDDELARAEAILNGRGIQEWGIYDAPGVESARTDYATPMSGFTGMPVGDPLGFAPATSMGVLSGMPVGDPLGFAPTYTNYGSTTPMNGGTGMALSQKKRAVGVFSSRRDAEHALHELRDGGFLMDKVSVVAKDADHGDEIAGAEMSDQVGNKADEGAATGAIAGGALGGLTGLLVGLGALAIPGIGPVMLAGATATAIATTLSGTAIGAAAGSLVGALVGLGIPEERARVYNERLSRGEYLVIVEGTDNDIRHAEAVLNRRGIQEWGIYDAPDVDTARTDYGATSVPVVDTTRTNYPGSVVDTEPEVTIVDRRDQTPDYNVVERYDTPSVAPAPTAYAVTTNPNREATGTAFGTQRRAVGVFPNRRDAEYALNELRDSGFPMDNVSVIAKDADRDDRLAGADMSDRVGNKADEGATAGAVTGGALGGLGGLLVGLGALAIPGIGPVMLAGAGATALATALTGGAIGAAAGGLLGALAGLGIPEERARIYNDRVTRGEYLVMVDGTDEQIHRAQAIFSNRGIQDWGIYDAPGVDTARVDYGATGAPVVDTTRVNYPANVADTDPNVTIIDRRNETL